MEKKKLFSINVSTGAYADFVAAIIDKAATGESNYACVANVHMLVEARRSKTYAQRVNDAAIVTPDGKPLTWAMKVLHGLEQPRVAGMDLMPDLLEKASDQSLPVFFYGGSEAMLTKTAEFLATNYPKLQVAGLHSPPFRQLSFKEEDVVIDKINRSGARLVFVVLGCPKQEIWMASMKGRIKAFMIGVGGAVPVMIGAQKRAPGWMQSSGLEWLYRLVQEPRRLFKRYAVTNSQFLWLMGSAVVRQKLVRKPRST